MRELDPMLYGKARGACLLQKYLPEKAVPFYKIRLAETVEDWEEAKETFINKEFIFFRADWLIDKPKPDRVYGANGYPSEIPAFIEQVRADSPYGAVLLHDPKRPRCNRYDYEGAFNILFLPDDKVIIELVGKAFDGHELTQGLAVHERYEIPWSKIAETESRRDLSLYGGITVSPEQYSEQRKQRVEYLTAKCHFDEDAVEKSVPKELTIVRGSLIEELLTNIVFELSTKKDDLKAEGLDPFCVQGNFANGEPQPWELFVTDRWA